MAGALSSPGADLHVHSTMSDGTLPPGQLLAKASAKNLGWISICDHDAMPDQCRVWREAKALGIRYLPGLELSLQLPKCVDHLAATCRGYRLATGEVHVLIYGWLSSGGYVSELLHRMQEDRRRRMQCMFSALGEVGIRVGWQDLFESEKVESLDTPGRPHLATALVRLGYVNSVRQAFERYLAPGRPGYVSRRRELVGCAIRGAREDGGIVALAHPALYRDPLPLMDYLRTLGIDGVEVVHRDHSFRDIQILLRYARTHRLLVTGGSDYHGRETDASLGSIRVPARWAMELESAIAGDRGQ